MTSQQNIHVQHDNKERLLDLFLNQGVELPYHGGLEPEKFTFGDESAQEADSGVAYNGNEMLWKNWGRKLARMGDEYLQEADTNSDSGKEAAYTTFKAVMGKAIKGTPAEEAYKVLGAVLLTLYGLNLLGEGA